VERGVLLDPLDVVPLVLAGQVAEDVVLVLVGLEGEADRSAERVGLLGRVADEPDSGGSDDLLSRYDKRIVLAQVVLAWPRGSSTTAFSRRAGAPA
jgi:hypothetical protein